MRIVLNNTNTNKKYLLAISGGADSMVLLHLFLSSGLNFSVAHCNFKLRGEDSELDEQFVRKYCKNHDVELFVRQFDTLQLKKSQESVEMLARKLRYDFFEEIIQKENFDFLVTAHHLNDNIETFFINFLRGAGVKGLAGIRKFRQKTFRPLLQFSKKEILEYAKENNLSWREDLSNQTLDYLRNKIRHQIVPELETINSSFLKNANKSLSILRKTQNFIENEAQLLLKKITLETSENKTVISLNELKSADEIIQFEIFSRFGFDNEKIIHKILKAQTGKYFENEKYKIWIDRDTLILQNKINNLEEENKEIIIEKESFSIEKPFNFEIFESDNFISVENKNTELVDLEKITFPLKLRKYRTGDYFYPVNGNGKKKISKFLKDNKISNPDKENIWVLCNSDEKIIWLLNHRLDDRFKLTPETKKALSLKLNS